MHGKIVLKSAQLADPAANGTHDKEIQNSQGQSQIDR